MSESAEPLTMSKREAAETLGVSRRTIDRYVVDGLLSATKMVRGRRGKVFLSRAEVLALVPSKPAPADVKDGAA